jgi:hypothetical protein
MRLHSGNNKIKIKIILLDSPGHIEMKRSELHEEIKRLAASYDVPEVILKNLSSGSKDFTRYFHCELQLLGLFLDNNVIKDPAYPYIGVSKRSCRFCKTIFDYEERFRTKGGHHKISANCAFFFPPRINYIYFVYGALCSEYGYMKRRLDKHEIGLNEPWSIYKHNDDTDPSRSAGQVDASPDLGIDKEAEASSSIAPTESGRTALKFVKAIKLGGDRSFELVAIGLVEVSRQSLIAYGPCPIEPVWTGESFLIPHFLIPAEGSDPYFVPSWIQNNLWDENRIRYVNGELYTLKGIKGIVRESINGVWQYP